MHSSILGYYNQNNARVPLALVATSANIRLCVEVLAVPGEDHFHEHVDHNDDVVIAHFPWKTYSDEVMLSAKCGVQLVPGLLNMHVRKYYWSEDEFPDRFEEPYNLYYDYPKKEICVAENKLKTLNADATVKHPSFTWLNAACFYIREVRISAEVEAMPLELLEHSCWWWRRPVNREKFTLQADNNVLPLFFTAPGLKKGIEFPAHIFKDVLASVDLSGAHSPYDSRKLTNAIDLRQLALHHSETLLRLNFAGLKRPSCEGDTGGEEGSDAEKKCYWSQLLDLKYLRVLNLRGTDINTIDFMFEKGADGEEYFLFRYLTVLDFGGCHRIDQIEKIFTVSKCNNLAKANLLDVKSLVHLKPNLRCNKTLAVLNIGWNYDFEDREQLEQFADHLLFLDISSSYQTDAVLREDSDEEGDFLVSKPVNWQRVLLSVAENFQFLASMKQLTELRLFENEVTFAMLEIVASMPVLERLALQPLCTSYDLHEKDVYNRDKHFLEALSTSVSLRYLEFLGNVKLWDSSSERTDTMNYYSFNLPPNLLFCCIFHHCYVNMDRVQTEAVYTQCTGYISPFLHNNDLMSLEYLHFDDSCVEPIRTIYYEFRINPLPNLKYLKYKGSLYNCVIGGLNVHNFRNLVFIQFVCVVFHPDFFRKNFCGTRDEVTTTVFAGGESKELVHLKHLCIDSCEFKTESKGKCIDFDFDFMFWNVFHLPSLMCLKLIRVKGLSSLKGVTRFPEVDKTSEKILKKSIYLEDLKLQDLNGLYNLKGGNSIALIRKHFSFISIKSCVSDAVLSRFQNFLLEEGFKSFEFFSVKTE